MKIRNPILISIFLIILLFACSKWELDRAGFTEVVTVGSIGVTSSSAFLIGDMEDLRAGTIKERGFVLSASGQDDASLRLGQPEVGNTLAEEPDSTQSGQAFGARAEGLNPDTRYFFRAFVQLEEIPEPIYGSIDTFSTTGLDLSIQSVRRKSGDCSGTAQIQVGLAEGQTFGIGNKVGIVWSEDENNLTPSLENDQKLEALGAAGSAQVSLDMDLECEKTYFLRAFVQTGSDNLMYSNNYAFTTTDGGKWLPKSSDPALLREDSYGFVIQDKIYLGGGRSGGQIWNDLWEYDPYVDSWIFLGQYEGLDIFKGIGFSLKGVGFVMLGSKTPNNDVIEVCQSCNFCPFSGEYCRNLYSVIHFFDPTFQLWQEISISSKLSFPLERLGGVGVSLDQKIFFGGGLTNRGVNNCHYQLLNDFLEFDPISSEIIKYDNIPGSFRFDAVGFSIQNKAYIGLGIALKRSCTWLHDTHNQPFFKLGDFYQFDPTQPSDSQWRTMATIPSDKKFTIGFTLEDKGYVINSDEFMERELWQFDPFDGETGSWKQMAGPPGLSSAIPQNAFSVGNLGFVLFDRGQEIFWMYVPEIE